MCFAMLYTTTVMAQKITGTVTNAGNPLTGISVSAKPSGKGVATGTDGKYSLALPEGTYKITFSGAGFQSVTETVTLASGDEKIVDAALTVSNETLETVVLVGSRSLPRTSVGSPLPIDNVDAATLKSTGQLTFDKALQYRVPSFNTVNTPVNDASTLLDPYEIRNLGPSRTLILINGKRKNLSSLLYVQFSPGRGETGADISAIPVEAIKNVEILRDGASAQYGSDAIAGVMNVILKDRYQYSNLTLTGGVTSKGDGGNYGLAFNSGANIGSKGFINYTIGLGQQNNTVRSGIIDLETEAATFNPYGSFETLDDFRGLTINDLDGTGVPINADGADATQAQLDNWNNVRLAQSSDAFKNVTVANYLKKYPTGNNRNGTGATTSAKFEYNLGLPVGENGMFYSNAAYVFKKVISNANFRTPYWRNDAGLLHVTDPGAPDYTGYTYGSGSGQLQQQFVADRNAGIYKGYIGYEPSFEGDLSDYNATVGFKNEVNGWKQDISITVGGNQQLYGVNNTVNRGLLKSSPTAFKPGGYGFSNVIGNFDISKSLTDNFAMGFGTEARKETYKIVAGDTASYSGQGSNSFPGIDRVNAGSFSRYNIGAYADASFDVTKAFLINGTVRAEKYSDFGSAFVYKLSSRVKIADDKLVLRGSFSTGFRAPTLHQIYAQSTQASFAGGTIVTSGLFNNNSKQAFLLGIPKLKAEKSTNFTLGLGAKPVKNLSLTLDYYDITIKDRIVYSSSISSDDPTTTLYQILQTADLVSVQFFINGIKTHTAGLDFVGSYRNIALGNGKLGINLAANYQTKNEIVGSPTVPKAIADAGSTILNTQIRSLLTESRPKYKAILGLDYHVNKFSVNLNNTLFGPAKFQDLDNGGSIMNNIKQVFKSAIVTDLNLGYDFTDKVNFSVTINNLLNVLPKWKLELTGSSSDPNYADAKATLANAADKSLLEGFLTFSGRYRILGYNGSHFSQLGTIFQTSLNIKF
jgi:iron complex outermembrane recepter protein